MTLKWLCLSYLSTRMQTGLEITSSLGKSERRRNPPSYLPMLPVLNWLTCKWLQRRLTVALILVCIAALKSMHRIRYDDCLSYVTSYFCQIWNGIGVRLHTNGTQTLSISGVPFTKHGLSLILIWMANSSIAKCCVKLLIISQTATVQPFKFGNG